MFLTITDRSSTTLHILLHVNIVFTIFWLILEILCFIFKLYHLSYPPNAFGIEIAMVIILSFNDFIRHFFGIKGNLVLKPILLIIFLLYSVFCSIGFVFFLVLQSFVQRVEILLSGIALALILIEVFLSIIVLILNYRAMPELSREEKILRFEQAQKRFQKSIKSE